MSFSRLQLFNDLYKPYDDIFKMTDSIIKFKDDAKDDIEKELLEKLANYTKNVCDYDPLTIKLDKTKTPSEIYKECTNFLYEFHSFLKDNRNTFQSICGLTIPYNINMAINKIFSQDYLMRIEYFSAYRQSSIILD